MGEDRRNVRRDEELVLAEADDDRRAVANGDDLLGIFDRHEDDREHAAHVDERPSHGVLEAVVAHLALNEMRHDLGVGFRLEVVSLRLEFLFQFEVVLDDAVVDDNDPTRTVAVGMGILFGRTAVRGPTRVAHTIEAINRLGADRVFEVGELASGPAQRDAFRADEGHARGVVAAVFHAT